MGLTSFGIRLTLYAVGMYYPQSARLQQGRQPFHHIYMVAW